MATDDEKQAKLIKKEKKQAKKDKKKKDKKDKKESSSEKRKHENDDDSTAHDTIKEKTDTKKKDKKKKDKKESKSKKRKHENGDEHTANNPIKDKKEEKTKSSNTDYKGTTFGAFKDTPFDAALVKALETSFDKPSPIQSAAWPAACEGKDVIAVAKTGSGKTLAFLLPIFHAIIGTTSNRTVPVAAASSPLGLVVAPTRELAVQIQLECEKFGAGTVGIVSLCCYGGTPVQQQIRALRTDKPHVVIGTPGRLQDLLNKEVLVINKCTIVVLDEADRMLDMGFEPQIKQIFSNLPQSARQVLLFSATWPKTVRKLASSYLRSSDKDDEKNNVVEVFLGGSGNPDAELEANKSISQTFIQATDDEKDKKMYDLLCGFKDDSRVVVFANTKRRVEMLAKVFYEFGTCAVHGDKDQRDREKALKNFVDNQCPVMFATDVAARGLDIKGVTHVINYDMARDVESYVHRIGRTGRAGELGDSITFWNPDFDKECSK